MIRLISYILFFYLFIGNICILPIYSLSQNIGFIENKGQFESNIRFVSTGANLKFAVTTNGFSIYDRQINLGKLTENRIDLNFQNADFSNFQISTKNQQINYFKSNLQIKLDLINSITIKEIYPKIDISIYLDQNYPRFDFILHPGANKDDIKMFALGCDNIRNFENKISFNQNGKSIELKNLKSYQISKNPLTQSETKNQEVFSTFNYSNNLISFDIPEYDKTKILIIDPLIYSEFFGGTSNDYIGGMVLAKNHKYYICGYTSSFVLPATTGAYQEDLKDNGGGDFDAFISHFDSLGFPISTTYFGGYKDDHADAITLDSNGNVLITGTTFGTVNFPYTKGAFDTIPHGYWDTYIAKFTPKLDTLLYSTRIGGANNDFGVAIILDTAQNIIIAGNTTIVRDSGFFPTTPNALQKVVTGGSDGFITVLNPRGDSLIFSTLIGGKYDEYLQSLDLDSNSKVYITGFTHSPDFPVTSDAYDLSYNDSVNDTNLSDLFISVIDYKIGFNSYSTYFGGSKRDGAYKIKLDKFGDIYLTGSTTSKNFPVKNAFDSTYDNSIYTNGKEDIFVSKFNGNNKNLIFSTYLGGELTDKAYDLTIDSLLNIYITGTTNSKLFPITINCFQDSLKDTNYTDAIVMKLSSDGKRLLYSSFIGGKSSDVGKTIQLVDSNTVIIGGTTSSVDFPYTSNSADTVINDKLKQDIFISKMYLSQEAPKIIYDYNICSGDTIQIRSHLAIANQIGAKFKWSPSSSLSSDINISPLAFPLITQRYFLTITDTSGKLYKDTINIAVGTNPDPIITGENIVLDSSIHDYFAIQVPLTDYSWKSIGGDIISNQNDSQVKIHWTRKDSGFVILYETNRFGCKDSTIYKVQIVKQDKPRVLVSSGFSPLCDGDTIVFDAGPSFKTILWNNGATGRLNKVTKPGKYYFDAYNLLNKHVVSDTFNVASTGKPPTPTIKFQNGIFTCLTVAKSYQWYYESTKIAGANQRTYKPVQPGYHKVEIKNDGNCSAFSALVSKIDEIGTNPVSLNTNDIVVYPNPSFGEINLIIKDFNLNLIKNDEIDFKLFDLLGNQLGGTFLKLESVNNIIKFKIDDVNTGNYLLQIKILDSVYFKIIYIIK